MARYREKDATDLQWNFTRREITRRLDTKIANWREEILNDLLTVAWDKFSAALESGESVQLEDAADEWIDQQMRKHFSLPAGAVEVSEA